MTAIYDTMQYIRPQIQTTVLGQAASAAAVIAAAGTPGKRAALPNARILIHQPTGGFRGQASDIEIHARESLFLRDRLEQIYVEHTGQDQEQINRDIERDRFMTPEEARGYGLIDHVIEQRGGTARRRPALD
jgi:ATP-dependent Clp protease protease subunit